MVLLIFFCKTVCATLFQETEKVIILRVKKKTPWYIFKPSSVECSTSAVFPAHSLFWLQSKNHKEGRGYRKLNLLWKEWFVHNCKRFLLSHCRFRSQSAHMLPSQPCAELIVNLIRCFKFYSYPFIAAALWYLCCPVAEVSKPQCICTRQSTSAMAWCDCLHLLWVGDGSNSGGLHSLIWAVTVLVQLDFGSLFKSLFAVKHEETVRKHCSCVVV